MFRALLYLPAALMALSLTACDDAPRFTKAEPGESRAGGAATVNKRDQNAFSLPSANLAPTRRLDFSVGNSFFRKAETRDIGPNDYHGGDGPVSVTTPKNGNNVLFHAMVEAGAQAGYPRTDDLNGFQQEGFGPMDRTVTPQGRRASTARGSRRATIWNRPSAASPIACGPGC